MKAFAFSCSAAVVLMLIQLVVLRKNLGALLRDESTQTVLKGRTYSLSKTLLFTGLCGGAVDLLYWDHD
jgi:hypothetical protein